MTSMAGFKASHFLWRIENAVAIIQLNRPERKNPLTFDSYAELRDTFQKLQEVAGGRAPKAILVGADPGRAPGYVVERTPARRANWCCHATPRRRRRTTWMRPVLSSDTAWGSWPVRPAR